MIFHVDGNSFYASCERLFRPDLYGKPIAVLTNNDGFICALTQECKDLGFKRGDVYFEVKEKINKLGVAVFSSNYTLYADICARLNLLYNRYCPDIELYSIDESFLFFPDWINTDYSALGRDLFMAARREIGIPVCVGIAPTKTLAKLCNKKAKKYGGVCDWQNIDQDEVLRSYPVGDVWGIGKAKTVFLEKNGIFTALDLKNYPLLKAKKYLTIEGMRTVQELNGIPAIEQVEPKQKSQIMCGKCFKGKVTRIEHIITALSEHTQEVVKRLRDDGLCCSYVTVFLTTNPYKIDSPQYANQATAKLNEPTAFLPDIEAAAQDLIKQIYRPGYVYRRTMILLSGIEKVIGRQKELFEDTAKTEKQENLMRALDKINNRYGRGTIRLGVARLGNFIADGNIKPWEMKRDLLSPYYTTRLADLPKVK